MDNTSILIQSVNLNDLENMIYRSVEKVIEKLALQPAQAPEEWLPRKEAAKFLRISVSTLDNWARAELVTPIHKGGLVFYAKQELLNHKK